MTYGNGDGMCVFMDTCEDKEAGSLLPELGNPLLPSRHLQFPRSFISIILLLSSESIALFL